MANGPTDFQKTPPSAPSILTKQTNMCPQIWQRTYSSYKFRNHFKSTHLDIKILPICFPHRSQSLVHHFAIANMCVIRLLAFFLLFSSSKAFNITKILSLQPDFSTFNNYLTQALLASEINSRQTITVLVVENSAMSALSGKSNDIIKKVLSLHVVLDYYDVQKLQHLPNETSMLTTLFQSSGQAKGLLGFLTVTAANTGGVSIASAAGSGVGASLVKAVVSQPYNISVVQISTVIMPSAIIGPTPPSSSPSPTPRVSPAQPPSSNPPAAASPTTGTAPAPSNGTTGTAPAPSTTGTAPAPSNATTAPSPSNAMTPSANASADSNAPAADSPVGTPPPVAVNGPTADSPPSDAADAPNGNTATKSGRISFAVVVMTISFPTLFVGSIM